MVPSRRRAGLVLAVALALTAPVLAGCASDTDAGDDGTATETSPEPSEDPTTEEPTTEPGTEGVPSLAADAGAMPLEAGARAKGLPPGVDAPTEGGTGAAWSAEPGLLYVVTYGSSTCPEVAEPDASVQDGAVAVTFVEIPRDTACTMDYVPATSVVAVPADVDASAEVTVVLGDKGSVTVPPAADGATGEATWVEQS